MRAVLIKDGKGPAENLFIGEEATPEPNKGEVQVKVSRPQSFTARGIAADVMS
jgi:hypothetical protein